MNNPGEFEFDAWQDLAHPPALKPPELLSLFRFLLGDRTYSQIARQIEIHKITPLSLLELDLPLTRTLLVGVPDSKLSAFPAIALDMVIHGAAPSIRSLPKSASANDIATFFGKWATTCGERKKLLAFLRSNNFTSLEECTLTPEMIGGSDMALGTRLALKCFLTRVYFFRRDEWISSMGRFYDLLEHKFCVTVEDLEKFRDFGYGLRNLHSASETSMTKHGVPATSARKIVIAKLIYADGPHPEKLRASHSNRIT